MGLAFSGRLRGNFRTGLKVVAKSWRRDSQVNSFLEKRTTHFGCPKNFRATRGSPRRPFLVVSWGQAKFPLSWAGRLALLALAGLLLAALLLLAGSFRLLGRLLFRHGQTSLEQPPRCNRHPSPQRMDHPGASHLAPLVPTRTPTKRSLPPICFLLSSFNDTEV